MKMKRAIHEGVINKVNQQHSSNLLAKRSKKYVKLNNGDRVTASGKIVTESGSKAKANKTGLYKRWKERSHSKISFQGPNNEGGSAMESTSLQGGRKMQRGGFRGRNKSRLVPNAHVRSEVKNLEQVRKERQTKATKAALMKNNPKKGKKFGKNASKRGKGRK